MSIAIPSVPGVQLRPLTRVEYVHTGPGEDGYASVTRATAADVLDAVGVGVPVADLFAS